MSARPARKSPLSFDFLHVNTKDTAVIRSLFTVLESKLERDYLLDGGAGSDALIVDLESESGKEWLKNSASDKAFIALCSSEGCSHTPFVLARPIRANQFLSVLHAVNESLDKGVSQSSSAEAGGSLTVHSETCVQMRRWPNKAQLLDNPLLMRLSALLSRRSMTAVQIADLFEIPVEEVLSVLLLCQRHGLLSIAGQPVQADLPADPHKVERLSLLKRIRRRLGI